MLYKVIYIQVAVTYLLNVVKPAGVVVGGNYGGLQISAAVCNWLNKRGEFPVLVIPFLGKVLLRKPRLDKGFG